MAAAEEYMQGRDNLSSAKINYFHYALHQLLGYDLHPLISQIHGSGHIRVADFGTQTAIWPIQVGESSPSAIEVHGFDRSDRFFPPTAWLPCNVHLHVQDVLQPFAPEMLASFDVVHLRLFLTLQPKQVSAMIESAVRLLRPGGYIQWIEHDKLALEITSSDPELAAPPPATIAFREMQQHPFPNYDPAWAHSLAGAARSAGLEIIADERIRMRSSLLAQLSDLHIMALMDVPAGLSPSIDAFKAQHMSALVEEFKSGAALVDGFVCLVARVPCG